MKRRHSPPCHGGRPLEREDAVRNNGGTPPTRPRWIPIATYVLLAINAAVFLADMLSNGALLVAGAKWGPAIWHGQPYRLLTAVFLHAGFIHLLANEWALYIVGPLVERLIGPKRFLILYLFSGLAGSAAGLLFSPGAASVGASGAIFGLFGYLLFLRWQLPRLFNRGLNQWLLSIVVLNLGITLLPGTNIDMFGHFGGLVGGLLGGLIVGPMKVGPGQTNVRLTRALQAAVAVGLLILTLVLGFRPVR